MKLKNKKILEKTLKDEKEKEEAIRLVHSTKKQKIIMNGEL